MRKPTPSTSPVGQRERDLGCGRRYPDAERHYRQWGAMATGLAVDAEAISVFIPPTPTAAADHRQREQHHSRAKLLDDGKAHFYLNLSLDTAGHRAFITDSKTAGSAGGRYPRRQGAGENRRAGIPGGAVQPDAQRSLRDASQSREVSVIDGKTYKVVKTFKTPTIPTAWRSPMTVKRCTSA